MAKFLLACAAWIAMMIILGFGVYYAAIGQPWLLVIGTLGFIVAVARIGCAAH